MNGLRYHQIFHPVTSSIGLPKITDVKEILRTEIHHALRGNFRRYIVAVSGQLRLHTKLECGGGHTDHH